MRITLHHSIAATLLVAGLVAGQARAAEHMKIMIDTTNPPNLAIMEAQDKGYFAKEGLEVEIQKLNASSTTLMPLLARGDLQISPVAVSGAFFNQFTSGFDIKLVAAANTAHPGWADTSWILVRQDVWASGAIKTPADLKGHKIELGPDGSPLMALMMGVLQKGGLDLKQVDASQHVRSQADMLAVLRNNAVDAVGAPEPLASQMQAQGLGHKWLSVNDINPGSQELFIAASGKYIAEHRDAVRHFLVAYLKGQQDVLAAGPAWTTETMAEMVKWSGFTEEQVRAFPGPTWPGALGTIDTAKIDAQQKMWLALGKVTKEVALNDVIDTSVLNEARKELGLAK